MNIKNCMRPASQNCSGSMALLLLRVVVGLAFAMHGWGKIQNPMAWMGPDAPVPGFLQLLAATAEFGGGILWIVGLFTPLASIFIAVTMLVAASMHAFVLKDPFVNPTGGSSYELATVYLMVALVFLTVGPGKLSLDHKIFGPRTEA